MLSLVMLGLTVSISCLAVRDSLVHYLSTLEVSE